MQVVKFTVQLFLCRNNKRHKADSLPCRPSLTIVKETTYWNLTDEIGMLVELVNITSHIIKQHSNPRSIHKTTNKDLHLQASTYKMKIMFALQVLNLKWSSEYLEEYFSWAKLLCFWSSVVCIKRNLSLKGTESLCIILK